LCVKEKVEVIPIYELFYKNKIRKLEYLKIDTEGHDNIIMMSLFNYIKSLPNEFYPQKILFESNENSIEKEVNNVINLFCNIGYMLEKRGYDTTLKFIK
jgi:hypothetical protein